MDDDGSPLTNLNKGFKRLFGKGKTGNPEDVTEEEIKSMVNEGHEQGIFKESEAEMINNIFTLDEKEAHDIMTHRKHIEAVDGTVTVRELLARIEDKGYSRYPVFLDDIDNIIGVIHIKDILNLVLKQDLMDVPIAQIEHLVRPAAFIPETRNIDILFKNMQSKKMHMVIVVDEYGQTAGLVTMEDILEEIVGNILDEHDKEDRMILAEQDGTWLIDGLADFHDVCEILSMEENEELKDFDTLNGFIISKIDKIPSDGETFRFGAYGYQFDIQKVENRMIRTVRVSKNTSSDDETSPVTFSE